MLSFSPSANVLQASSKQNSSGLGIGATIGIVAVVVVLLITVAILTCICLRRRTRKSAFSTCRISCHVPDVKKIQHEYIGTTK